MKNEVKKNNLSSVKNLVDDFLNLEGNVGILEHKSKALQYYKEGLLLFGDNNYLKAIQQFELAIIYDSTNVVIYYNLAITYASLENYTKALIYFNKAIECNPNVGEIYYDKGLTLKKLGEYNQAIDAYQSALKVNPSLTMVYSNLAELFNKLKQYDKAIEMYDMCICNNLKDVSIHYNKGVTLHAMKKYEAAITEYNKAIQDSPSEDVYLVKAGALYMLSDFREVIATYQKILMINPNNTTVKHNMKIAIFKLPLEERSHYMNILENFKKEAQVFNKEKHVIEEYNTSNNPKQLNLNFYKKKAKTNEEKQKIDEEGSQAVIEQSNIFFQSQYSQNASQFVASQSSKMEEETEEEEEWQPSGLNQQKQQKLLTVTESKFNVAILNNSEILKQFSHKHGSSNTNKLIDLCHELGNTNLSELEELLYSKTDLASNQAGDAQLSELAAQINLAPLELLMGLDSSINEQL